MKYLANYLKEDKAGHEERESKRVGAKLRLFLPKQ